MKYKRVIITRHGGPEVLQVIEEELPEPQAGEVRVNILATSVLDKTAVNGKLVLICQ